MQEQGPEERGGTGNPFVPHPKSWKDMPILFQSGDRLFSLLNTPGLSDLPPALTEKVEDNAPSCDVHLLSKC